MSAHSSKKAGSTRNNETNPVDVELSAPSPSNANAAETDAALATSPGRSETVFATPQMSDASPGSHKSPASPSGAYQGVDGDANANVDADADTRESFAIGGPTTDIPMLTEAGSVPPIIDDFKFPLTIAFRHASVKLKVPVHHNPLPNIFSPVYQLGSAIGSWFKGIPSSRDFYRVKNASGLIRPGTTTLVLSPPGHGKTSYLKMISNEISRTGGVVTFNGVPVEKAGSQGVDARKLCVYQEQTDFHLSLLNVWETIQFASQMSSVHGHDDSRVERIISALGLDEAKSTLIGDAMVKGISGGQKRRVTTAIAMASDAVCLCLDEYSNGLDSAVTERITEYFVNWARQNQTSVVATLQQPTPSVFDMFDRVVLLREGEVVYDGPREDTLPFLEALGFKCQDDVDACDFVIDVLSAPQQALYDRRLNELREQRLAQKKKSRKAYVDDGGSRQAANNQDQIQNKQLQQLSARGCPSGGGGGGVGTHATVATSMGPIRLSPAPCLTTQDMLEYYHTTPFWAQLDKEINQFIAVEREPDDQGLVDYSDDTVPTTFPLESTTLLDSSQAQTRFAKGFRLPFFQTLKYSLIRQGRLVSRNKALIISKWLNCFIVSLIIAGLFYQVPHENATLRVAGILLSMSQSIYVNMIELASATTDKKIVMREVNASMYPSIAYVISAFTANVPFSLFDPIVFTFIFYFMEGFYLGFKEMVCFWFLLVLTTWSSWSWFRFCAMLMPDMPSAIVVAAQTVSYFNTFSGFYIAYGDVQNWLLWLFWLSPYSWIVRAFAINEFNSPAYDQIVNNALTGEPMRLGDANLTYVDMFAGEIWILYCTIYIIGFCIVFLYISSLLLRLTPPELTRGTRRVKDGGEDDLDLAALEARFAQVAEQEATRDQRLKKLTNTILHSQHEHASRVAASGYSTGDNDREVSRSHLSRSNMSTIVQSALTGFGSGAGGKRSQALATLTQELPFYPTALSFSDLTYTVRVKNLAGNTSDRVLLSGISGTAQPGEMVALMGASGAGKTTLLDVIAGLKNTGVVTGKILFNGVEADKEARGVLTGYVQQFASLWGFSSVEETLIFAARLRMARDIPDATKKLVVEEILDILDLKAIRHFIIGNMMTPGLSPSQIKRVSIGLEMVANPAVLFLDEPTTGLDSKNAATLLKAIKRVASTGRTIIATVHQPSAELYYFFDRLYLLAPGGHQIFGGDVGYRSHDFIKYFSQIPGVAPMPLRSNPANWMLSESSKVPDPTLISLAHIKAHTTVLEDNDLDDEAWEKDVIMSKKWTFYLKWHYFHTSVAWYQVSQNLNIIEDIYYTQFPELPRPKRQGPDRLPEAEAHDLRADDNNQNSNPAPSPTPTAATTASAVATDEQSVSHADAGADAETDPQAKTNAHNADDAAANAARLAQQGLTTPEHPSIFNQFRWLLARHFTLYFRNWMSMSGRLYGMTVTSVVTGLIYLNFEVKDASSVLAYAACIVMLAGSFSFNLSNPMVPTYIYHRPVFYREVGQGYYSYAWIWSICNTINEFVWCIPLIFLSLICWFMVGYPSSAEAVFQWLLILYVTMLTFLSAQQFFSSLVPNLGFSQLATSMLTGLAFNLNGVGTTRAVLKSISGFHEALYWILPLGPMNLFISDVIFSHDPTKTINVVQDGVQIPMLLQQFAQNFFGFTPGKHWFYIGVLFIQMAVWQCAYHISTTFLNHNKR